MDLTGRSTNVLSMPIAPKVATVDTDGTGVRPSVTVVIPTFNEQDGIDWVLQNIPQSVDEVVLIDGLSTDQTEALARTLRPELVVVHQHVHGKGAAVRAGFAAASGQIVVMLDADGSTDPREIPWFVEALVDGADFVKGSRSVAGGGSEDFTPLRCAGNRGFVMLVNLLFGARFTDLCYGYVAFWRRNLGQLALTANGFEIETALVLGALKADLEIREVPSFELARRAGKSNLNAFRDGWRVLREILRLRFTRAPDPAARITFVPAQKPSQHSGSWLPAGIDRRRFDRRRLDPDTTGYSQPDRRAADRRQPECRTVTVYVVDHERRETPGKFRPLPAD
jgi:hypothetical protein